MFKKIILVLSAIALVLGSVTSIASAATVPVANTTQKGSLLIYPKVIAIQENEEPLVDTIIYMANDSPSAVYVKCYWVDENQTIEDF